jgi:hypothetical protein
MKRVVHILYMACLVHCVLLTVRHITKRYTTERDKRSSYTALRFYAVIQHGATFWYTGKSLKIDAVGCWHHNQLDMLVRAQKLMTEYIESYLKDKRVLSPVGWRILLLSNKQPLGAKDMDDLRQYLDKNCVFIADWVDNVLDAIDALAK